MSKRRIRALIEAFKKKYGRLPHRGELHRGRYEPSERRHLKRGLIPLAALLALFLGACTQHPKPQPPQPPPPEPQCAEGQNHSCWHRPPDSRTWLYACPVFDASGGVVGTIDVVGGPAQCPGKPGTPEPPEPPATTHPGQSVFPELELRQPVPPNLTRGGQPFTPFGCISCCKPPPEGMKTTGWPGYREEWSDFCASYGANFLHFRFGPYFATPETEGEWADTGGPYTGKPWEPPTLVFNEPYWKKAHEVIHYAGAKNKQNTQAVLIDTWWCKVCQWGSQPCAWPQEDIEACGRRPSPEQRRFIRKVVETIGCDASVVFMTGNESGEISGATQEWQEWVIAEAAQAEKELGCGVVHMKGVDDPTWREAKGRDYVSTHSPDPLTQNFSGVHSENNERDKPRTPEEEYSIAKGAEAIGAHWWAWRGDQSEEDFRRTLELRKPTTTPTPPQCYPPPDDPVLWVKLSTGGPTNRKDEVQAGQAKLGSLCKEPLNHQNGIDAILALADQLRKDGLCAGTVGALDAVFVLEEGGDGRTWSEMHAVAPFDTGCWSTSNNHYPLNRFRYDGKWSPPSTTPPPSDPCPVPVPTVDEVLCKLHQAGQGLWDCTPKANGQPILPEGDPNRVACEKKAMGGVPTYVLTESQGLSLEPVENPMQFRIFGSGSGLVTCTVPAVAGNVCAGGGTSTGVSVSR